MGPINHWNRVIGSQNIHLSKPLKGLKCLVQTLPPIGVVVGKKCRRVIYERWVAQQSRDLWQARKCIVRIGWQVSTVSKWRQILTLSCSFVAEVPLIAFERFEMSASETMQWIFYLYLSCTDILKQIQLNW